MAEPEINVEVNVPGEGETSSEESPSETVVVVAPAAERGTDAGTILSLEMLRDQVQGLTDALAINNVRLEGISLEMVNLANRLVDLETEEIEEETEPSGEIVVETIPPVEAAVESETKPEPRKRRFV